MFQDVACPSLLSTSEGVRYFSLFLTAVHLLCSNDLSGGGVATDAVSMCSSVLPLFTLAYVKFVGRFLSGWAWLTSLTFAMTVRPSIEQDVDICRRHFLCRRQMSSTIVGECEQAVSRVANCLKYVNGCHLYFAEIRGSEQNLELITSEFLIGKFRIVMLHEPLTLRPSYMTRSCHV